MNTPEFKSSYQACPVEPGDETTGLTHSALEVAERIPLEEERVAQIPDATKCRIWSGQWSAWWRPNGKGYTQDIAQAGIYAFRDAFERTCHCGPEKEIAYELLREPSPDPRDAEIETDVATLAQFLRVR